MGKSKVEMNDGALDGLFQEIGQKIESTDKRFRVMNAGRPAVDLEAPAKIAFARIGVELQPGQVREYAEAVANDEPFEWVLQ